MSIKLFAKNEINFVAGASRISNIPKLYLPEFAFIGKSNVGKSSLINAICNRKALAKVSHTPGRTQQINFFQVGGECTLVDLPGYGFAKVPHSVKQNWEKLVVHYLSNRSNLLVINLLIDSRRGIASHDREVINLLQKFQRLFQIVFTKSDQISDRISLVESSKIVLSDVERDINFIFTSARGKDGIRELQNSMGKALT